MTDLREFRVHLPASALTLLTTPVYHFLRLFLLLARGYTLAETPQTLRTRQPSAALRLASPSCWNPLLLTVQPPDRSLAVCLC